MIPGRPIKIMLVDDTERGEAAARHLLRKGYLVEVTTPGWAMQQIMPFWPDIIAIAVPGTSIEDTCRDNEYLQRKRIIRCYDDA